MRKTLAAFVSVLAFAAVAHAQEIDPPPAVPTTSGDASLSSGRTNGSGEVIVAAAAGWPGIWVEVEVAFDSVFNAGLRLGLVYGSPFMALAPGVGGEAAVPLRLHVFGEDKLDLAIFATPAFVIGEAAITGEGGTAAAGDLGIGSRIEGGLVAGYRALDDVTLILGLGGHVGVVGTPSTATYSAVGGVFARIGIEGLISRDTLLFAVGDAGIGIAPTGSPQLFGDPVTPLLRLSLGVGYVP
ncbi:MAG: hypothetical protein AB7S26_00310 [Sandaracinaceae bacterium]